MKKQAVNLGRIGILLPVAVIIPFLGFLAGLAAFILLLISFHNFSRYYETPGIFKNALVGFILPLAGGIVGGIILVAATASSFFSMSSMDMENLQDLTAMINKSVVSFSIAGVIMFGSYIIGYFLFFKSMKMLAEKSGIKHFKTAGLLYFVGIIVTFIILVVVVLILVTASASPFLTFLLLIGSIIMLVGWVFHIIAYFTIKTEDELPEKETGTPESEA
ncbi:MAG: DUF996 domain-containing protein [Bacteroidota bacterium]